jgi:hypothetical protein
VTLYDAAVSGADYCRAIEHHVCLKNDGHLIRIVGPAFEVVSRWEHDGVPLKVALRGIDRYFERYYRKRPRRRPVQVEFCDTDVREVFDEWRRAVGLTASALSLARESHSEEVEATASQRGPSLPAHLERVVLKLSSARATGRLGAEADRWLDQLSTELDVARGSAGGVRGDRRVALIARLGTIDGELMAAARAGLSDTDRQQLGVAADEELDGFRARMTTEAYLRARDTIVDRLVRERFGLPVIVFT